MVMIGMGHEVTLLAEEAVGLTVGFSAYYFDKTIVKGAIDFIEVGVVLGKGGLFTLDYGI